MKAEICHSRSSIDIHEIRSNLASEAAAKAEATKDATAPKWKAKVPSNLGCLTA
jgi:hypothetical protein